MTNPTPLRAAQPTLHGNTFDAWNSSSTGHQHAENRLSGSTSWRDSRTLKLAHQLKDGTRGGDRLADTVGGGSEGFGIDGRTENGGWVNGASGLRPRGQRSLWECVGARPRLRKPDGGSMGERGHRSNKEQRRGVHEPILESGEGLYSQPPPPPSAQKQPMPTSSPEGEVKGEKKMFEGVVVYVNGSTYPVISDHKLKYLLVENGARLSLGLARRRVTHVIVGTSLKTASSSSISASKGDGSTSRGLGTGGGLAGGKLEKEIASLRGKKVRFVTAEWVVECVKQGRRVPEGPFEGVGVKREKQRSVVDMQRRSLTMDTDG